METVRIAGDHFIATSPEGKRESLPIGELSKVLSPAHMDTGGALLPERVCAVRSGTRSIVWVHQSSPAVYSLRWIADDSPAPFGRGATYRDVRLALPYVVVLVVFEPGPGGMNVSSWNECFFSNRPLRSLDDELCYPALLNCSKFTPSAGRPLSWICTQHLTPVPPGESDLNRRLWQGYASLLRCLFETSFNRSSEQHEGTSWYEESRGVDVRIGSVASWEAASREDPGFVLDVPWLPVRHTLGQVLDRIFVERGESASGVRTEQALARVILRNGQRLRLAARRAERAREQSLAAEAASQTMNLF